MTSKKKSKKRGKNIPVKKTRAKKTRRKIKYGRILIALLVLFGIIYLFFTIFSFKIRNIYIKGNNILSDQDIIELAGVEDYPSVLTFLSGSVEKKLEKNLLIKNAKVSKKNFFELHITVEENTPLFYNKTTNKTVYLNSKEQSGNDVAPTLINYVPDKIYKRFISKMKLVNFNTIKRISEIEYSPNDVDKNRFLLYMQDGNYVYLTLDKFDRINSYMEIIKKFENKKGILYLDSGEYFKVYEGE